MTVQYSTTLRNAQLDQIETVAGASPRLHVRTGAPPANCAAADAGSLLADIALPADFMAAAAGGVKAKAGTWSGTASGTGTAGHFRIKDAAGTTCHLQGTITATGGGGDMTVDSTSVTAGQTVTVNTFSVTAGNA